MPAKRFRKTALHRPRTRDGSRAANLFRLLRPSPSFLLSFAGSLRSLAHSFLHSRSTVSRGISKNQYRRKARRGRKKIRYPLRLSSFLPFLASLLFFLQRELRSRESLVPLWSPEGRLAIRINSIFEEENSRRKWQREPTGTEEARENLFSQKCSAASVQSLPLPAE